MRRRAKHNLKKGFLIAGKRKTVVKSPLGGRGSSLRALKDSDRSSICIIRSVGGIGDVLMITPALRELKVRYPKSKLTFAVDRHTTSGDNYYELVKNAWFIDHIIDARDVVHAMRILESGFTEDYEKNSFELLVSTNGGSALEMFSIYDTIRMIKEKAPVCTVGLGKVMSAAVLLLAAGTKGQRKIGANCRLMIHGVISGQQGHLDDLENEMEESKWMQKQYIKALAVESNMTEKYIRNLMKRRLNVYIDAKEAVELGIADVII